jgi:SPP1 gp7 family putative phage head morphogenesis protein
MKNSDYWRKRAEMLESQTNAVAGKLTAEVQHQFDLAQKTLDEQIEQWYGRFAKNNEITLAEARKWLTGKDLSEFKWDVDEYIKYGKENALNGQWVKQLENASAKFHISKLESLKMKTQNTLERLYGQAEKRMTSAFGDIYKDSCYRTIYTLQQGFNVGWDVAAINEQSLEKVLVKPWTLDKTTFSDRIWKQKQALVDEVHTQLTQNMILGKSPDAAIKAISQKFGASKSNAGRLVMTESAYFANAADKAAYAELGVEEFEIVGTLDGTTCEICGGLDGSHLPLSQFEAGVTAPPFHPWCRCTTAPYFEDEAEYDGSRFARGEDGKAYYVPQDMTYKDWKEKFVDGGDKNDLTAIANIREDNFKGTSSKALSTMKTEATEFLKYAEMLDKPYKSVYTYYVNNTEFAQRDDIDTPFGYAPKADVVVFNPADPDFGKYDINRVLTHELTHRYDNLIVHSWENADFIKAVNEARNKIMSDLPKWRAMIDREDICDEILDILSGLSEYALKTKAGHSAEYWKADKTRLYKEIFAELSILAVNKEDLGAFDGLLNEIKKILLIIFEEGSYVVDDL